MVTACPVCGAEELVATALVYVSYIIDGGDWERDAVDDDSSDLRYATCLNCKSTWQRTTEGEIEMDGEGYIKKLSPNPKDKGTAA